MRLPPKSLLAAVALFTALTASASSAAPAAGTKLLTVNGPLGQMLVVGSGKFMGYSVYMFTGDASAASACGTTKVKLGQGNGLSCTGPMGDSNAEWPAVTTTAAPVAGPGVESKLLGTMKRGGIGEQLTYDGHPLYLFDQSPGSTSGVGFVEGGLPPWHGVWYLVSPAGTPLNWPTMLTETQIKGKPALGLMIETLVGLRVEPVYAYSKGTACTGACAAAWPPVLTDGTPGVASPLSASKVGAVKQADGATQVTYDGKPLYLYAQDAPTKSVANDGEAFLSGAGAGLSTGGGTFELATP